MTPSNTNKYEWFDLTHIVQPKGTTLPIEFDATFPFEVKRIYSITGNKTHLRGGHAHQKEEEVFVCLSGSFKVLLDQGQGPQIFEMNTQNKALWVKTYCWHEFFDFSPDAIMLCISSVHYTPGAENYITNKDDFYTEIQPS